MPVSSSRSWSGLQLHRDIRSKEPVFGRQLNVGCGKTQGIDFEEHFVELAGRIKDRNIPAAFADVIAELIRSGSFGDGEFNPDVRNGQAGVAFDAVDDHLPAIL